MPTQEYDDCWLRYREADGDAREGYEKYTLDAYVGVAAPEFGAIRDELREALSGMLGREPQLWQHPPHASDSFLAIGQRHDMQPVGETIPESDVEDLGESGFVIRTVEWEGHDVLVVTADHDRGLVFGTFHLLRMMQCGDSIEGVDITEVPANTERVINHWDNPFRCDVERGYAGQSIFFWERLPSLRERYDDYGRLLASIGINGVVLNNVNTSIPGRGGANDAVNELEGYQLLESENLEKVEALAGVFRRYGIQVYLSINYAAPMLIGDLDTADPLDEDVQEWWAEKADELYERIPDFGGFLVKADSEGQNGPYDYDRNHAEGANVLGEALEPHGGRVFWRAFVYSEHEDRAVQAYETFEPLDGDFHDNVTVQIKNGPIDFQPREPVSTLFGAMPETNLACELQITGEYTGQGVHACSHVPMWEEILNFDTYADGEGSEVKDVLGERDGEGFAGVSSLGEDPSWTGHYLMQTNLHGFGRLAWDPSLSAEEVTTEWAELTFGDDPEVVGTVTNILIDSWDAVLDYETGHLGLMHMMYNQGDVLENHYDPDPRDWPEYIGADETGVGLDRTESGSAYTTQYREPVAERYEDPETCPEKLLLFFHHLDWEYKLENGDTVVQRLYDNLFEGVEETRELRERWQSLEGKIDEKRFRHVDERFAQQVVEAERWRDHLATFFYEHSGIEDDGGRVPIENPRAETPTGS